MRGHGGHPLGWAALALIVVAYGHVILEVAVAVLCVAIAVKTVMSPAPEMLVRGVARQVRSRRRRRELEQQACGWREVELERGPDDTDAAGKVKR